MILDFRDTVFWKIFAYSKFSLDAIMAWLFDMMEKPQRLGEVFMMIDHDLKNIKHRYAA